jgi:integrase
MVRQTSYSPLQTPRSPRALKEIESKDRRDRRGLERTVKKWLIQLQDQGLAAGTVNNYYNDLRSFFESQDLPFSLKSSDRPKVVHIGRRMVTKKLIRKMTQYSSHRQRPRNTALIFFLKDTGLRIGDISFLNKDIYLSAKEYRNEDGERFKEFAPIRTRKTGEVAYIIIGPETIEHLELYLNNRTDTSPALFLGERGGRMTTTAISHLFQRNSDKLGEDGGRISAHSFRKYHQTQLEASGLNPNILKRLHGRKIVDSTGAYSRPQDVPGLLVEQYMKHYDAIRLDVNSEIREMRKEQRDSGDQVQSLTTEVQQLKSLLLGVLNNPAALEETKRRLKKNIARALKSFCRVISI